LQILYQEDLNPGGDPALIELFVERRLQSTEVRVFATSLINGVRQNLAELDSHLEQIADNWSLLRMAATDRNILRMAAYEIVFTGTPGRVVINEAIELAKRFGSTQSSRFVNGILDRVLALHPSE
jgi:N utilization substance protein B